MEGEQGAHGHGYEHGGLKWDVELRTRWLVLFRAGPK